MNTGTGETPSDHVKNVHVPLHCLKVEFHISSVTFSLPLLQGVVRRMEVLVEASCLLLHFMGHRFWGGGFPLTLPMRWTPNEILSLLIFSPPALQLRYLHEKHRWEAEITCPHLHGHWQEEGEMQVGILRTEARRMDRFGADTDSCAVGFHFVPEKQDHEMRQYS